MDNLVIRRAYSRFDFFQNLVFVRVGKPQRQIYFAVLVKMSKKENFEIFESFSKFNFCSFVSVLTQFIFEVSSKSPKKRLENDKKWSN